MKSVLNRSGTKRNSDEFCKKNLRAEEVIMEQKPAW